MKLKFNKPQFRLIMSQPREAVNIWARGTGKSYNIAWLMHLIQANMPRSAWSIVGQSYRQILTRTLPGTLSALSKLGYERDKDFFVKRRPPAKISHQLPFEAPLDFEHFILFRNGTGFHLVSQDPNGGSSRGLNIDGIIADESLLLDKKKLDEELMPTNRGNLEYFKGVPFHHGIFHFSSMPYGNQAPWLLEYGNYYDYDFGKLRNEAVEVQIKLIDSESKEEKLRLWREAKKIRKQIYFEKNKKGLLYAEADVFDNLDNLGLRYIYQQRRDLDDLRFRTEVMNQRPSKIEGAFYPHLERLTHGYRNASDNSYLKGLDYTDKRLKTDDSRMDADCDKYQPLRIAVDWGSRINCMTICQFDKEQNTLRFLKNLFVKPPEILTHLARRFCEYYRYHQNKEVFFAYDHTGNSKMANSQITYAEQFSQILRKEGWLVHMVSKGAPPTHQNKYLLWSLLLQERDPVKPKIRFNLDNAHETFVSMELAPAKDGRSGIEKNKQSERNPGIAAEKATDLSDTADIQVFSLFENLLYAESNFVDAHY
jgi:hypothetical protein